MTTKDNFVFKGLFTPMSYGDFKESQNENKSYADGQMKFNTLIAENNNIEGLRNILNNQNLINNASSNQLMRLFTAFRDLNAFKEMIELYNKSVNKTFKDSIMVKELIMVAYNKIGMPKEAIKIGNELIKQGKISGDVFGGLGKAYALLSKEAEDQAEKNRYLKASRDAYEGGFAEFAEFYPGINAVYRNIDLGQIDRAKELANIVYLSCKKEGAKETNDYWCTATKLEAGCIAGKPHEELDESLNDLLSYNVPKWQFESTLESLKSVNKTFKSSEVETVILMLEYKIENLGKETEQLSSMPKSSTEEKLDSIIGNSYSYRGLASNFEGASSVGGNFRYGGQLPDHSISRKDIEVFDGILNAPIKDLFSEGYNLGEIDMKTTLSDIKDVDKFLKVIDKFIRYHYGTENFAKTGLHLEKNAEINNSVYDQTVNSLISLSGIKGNKLADSRTNISAIFALGLGDCRHHAQVKQLMFDRWQGKKMTKALLTAYACMNNEQMRDKAIETFNDLYNVELRTIDVGVKMPIKIKGIYNAEKINDKFIEDKDGNASVLEEHTMNILIKRNKDGKLEELYITDAFYQNNYDWSHFKVDLDTLEVEEGGKFNIKAGELDGSLVDSGKNLQISIVPTAYAGKRDVHSKDDHGNNITLLGIPLNIKLSEDLIRMLKQRKIIEDILNDVRKNGEIENQNNYESQNS